MLSISSVTVCSCLGDLALVTAIPSIPDRAKPKAISRPNPRPPPVTIATFPVNSTLIEIDTYKILSW